MAGFTFGATPATTTAPTSFGFENSSLSFGSAGTSTNPSGLTFGAPNTNATVVGGGLNTANTQSGGFTFGSSSALNFKGATTTTTSTTGFSLGATNQTLPQPQPTFGTPASTSGTSGLSFFSTPTSTQPSTSISLGTTPLQTGGTGLYGTTQNAAQPGTTLSLGVPASTTATTKTTLPTLSFGTSDSSALTTATPVTTTGLSFGFPSSKTTASTGFSLPSSTGSTGVFGFSTTTTSAPGATTSAPVFKGLGGVDTTQSLTGIGGASGGGRSESKTVKENQVPNDIIVSVEGFKNFVKNQKNLSCEVARASVKPMAKVTEDTQALQQLLSSLVADVQKNNILAERLKAETSKCFAQCEMAQRTHDTPAGLQNDNTAPLEFFMNLAAKFEYNVHVLRQEIDRTEKHVNTLNQPASLTPQELSMALKKLHESFVALAGRLQVVHQSVIVQKERHLSLRRHFLKDPTNIFVKPSLAAAHKKSGIAAGPTPFSDLQQLITSIKGAQSCQIPVTKL